MTRYPLIKVLMALTAALFLFAQASTLAHGAESAIDTDHHQDCVTCVVALATSDAVSVEPAVETQPPLAKPAPSSDFETYREIATRRTLSRAPPPRGPPALA